MTPVEFLPTVHDDDEGRVSRALFRAAVREDVRR